MKVAFTATNEEVRLVLSEGFAALPATASADATVVLTEGGPEALLALNGRPAVLLDIPPEFLSQFEEPVEADGGTRTFALPPPILDRYPILAYRAGHPPGGRPPARRRAPLPRAWLPGTLPWRPVAAALVVLIVAATAFYLIRGGGEDEPDPSNGSPTASRAESAASQKPPTASRRGESRTPGTRSSRAIGSPNDGRLANGVPLPREGNDFFTWNVPKRTSPNPRFRRFATARVIDRIREVVAGYRRAHPRAPRVGIADLSLPRGGDFGVEFGGSGHVSHQNGLEVDILYPRLDREERAVTAASEVDLALTQELLDRFAAAGAAEITVDPALELPRKPSVVKPRAFHEEHMHIRFPAG